MSVKLMVEVLDHAPDEWTPAERLVVVAIAEWIRDGTRTGCPPVDLVARRAGIDAKSLSRMLRRLVAKGYELRVPVGVDKKGQTVYAHRGHRTVFQVPKMCPHESHSTVVCARLDADAAAERADHRPPFTTESDKESPDHRPPIEGESPDHRPPFAPGSEDERADHRPPKTRERADNERRKGGPPSAPSPQSPQRTTPKEESAAAPHTHTEDDATIKPATNTNGQASPGAITALFDAPLPDTRRTETNPKAGKSPSTHPSLKWTPAEIDTDPAYREFWATYPSPKGKGKARDAWLRAIRNGASPDVIAAGARAYRDDPTRTARYTKHAATWLNQECWADYDRPVAESAAARSQPPNNGRRFTPFRNPEPSAYDMPL